MESSRANQARAEAAVPGAKIESFRIRVQRSSVALIDNEHARGGGAFLARSIRAALDFCSNVTGVDWLDRTVKKRESEEARRWRGEGSRETRRRISRLSEAVYHLYSMTHKHGPVIIRMRTPTAQRRARCLAHSDLAQRGISGTRNFRSLRHSLRRASRIYGGF
jgi:NADH-quinone oxidoreductase subunit C